MSIPGLSGGAGKVILLVALGVMVAGYVMNMAYTSNIPVLSDAAKGFK